LSKIRKAANASTAASASLVSLVVEKAQQLNQVVISSRS
jgi:hypothetical protein